ncbi:MAG: type II toxin-antitoxin system RelE/ParE family toxin [Prolixibacteraceae bacterium]|jgi:plasmid stabilization system protein ParE|nr:type II toxin-antitoxin system RelE/ParE family toxin [Prolixibacteraceae bacterium]
MKKLPIRWDRLAKENLDAIYDYIADDSVMAARMVKKELVKLAHSLKDFPEKFAAEENLADIPGNYRSVAKWSYKIIYEVCDDYIIIVDIFHTSLHPHKITRNLK